MNTHEAGHSNQDQIFLDRGRQRYHGDIMGLLSSGLMGLLYYDIMGFIWILKNHMQPMGVHQ